VRMPIWTRLLSAAAVVASAVLVAAPMQSGRAAPATALAGQGTVDVATAATGAAPALASAATSPDLVPVTPTIESHPIKALPAASKA
jgi:hypothetical protein